ncbi:alpha/beta hydrolase [Streptomyces sp. NPDC007100]|uniref:alpha/beta hydrolase family protein n=1 Tax=Streptomyces sp. NPDC007100 TaxID=3155602 RepID=UPI0033FDE1BB
MATQRRAYGPSGKHLDDYRPAGAPVGTVLLWHGIGPDERDILEPLADAMADQGLRVLVPDWRSDAEDGGRAHLLESLTYARSAGGPLVLVGWSAGAGAAVGVALHPDLFDGWAPTAVFGVAGRYDVPARTTGVAPLDDLAAGRVPAAPVRLAHGASDSVVPVEHSRALATALRCAGHAVHLEEPPTDHAGVIMTEYDAEAGRCRATRDEAALRAGVALAREVALVCGGVGVAQGGDSSPHSRTPYLES